MSTNVLLLLWVCRLRLHVQAFKYKKFVTNILNDKFTIQCGYIFTIVQDL